MGGGDVDPVEAVGLLPAGRKRGKTPKKFHDTAGQKVVIFGRFRP